ncbi:MULTISPECIES: oligosaccharide flippase family protein [Sphingomonas]|uniref:oligosaccharide flippase family protein n=1 Tax=Sphingomonas TaxID=13687 RepID=UPI000DEFBE62|nr:MULTISPECIES: oligosaccharide flippase family protein [Sphingomonas]
MSVRLSLFWSYLAQISGFVITFGSTIVVARLVSPRDFGIFAMATAVTTVINVFMQFGLAKYLMREAEITRELLRSLFTVNVLLSLFYVAAILVGAVTAEHFVGSQDVGRFLYVFALFPLFAMMEFIPEAICSRDGRFGVISLLSIVRAIVIAVTTLFFAWNGYAFLSFAWAQVFAWAVTATCFNVLVWRPDAWRLRFKGIREILHFGSQMIGIRGLAQLGTRGGEMALGSLLGLTSLGLYSRASSLPNTLFNNVFGAAGNVIYSRMSLELRETGQFHQTYIRFMRLLLGIMWPMMFGLAVLSKPAINLLYGAKWQPAAEPLSFLALATAVTIALGLVPEVFILRHQTKQQFGIETVRTIAGLSMFVLGAFVGLTAAAGAKLAEAVLALALYRRPLNRMLEGPNHVLAKMYGESFGLGLIAALPSLLLMIWTRFSASTSLIAIAGAVALGGLLWSTALWRLRHPLALEVIGLIKRRR